MGLSRWLPGSRDGALDPLFEGSKQKSGRDTFNPRERGHELADHHAPFDIPFSKDWQEALRAAVSELGSDLRCVLVTDALGIEVNASDQLNGNISRERFPLRLRCTQQPSLQRRNSKGSSTRSPTQKEKEEQGKHNTQISLEIQFADVWPGVLKVKLDQHGFAPCKTVSEHLNFLVATDATGVELNLKGTRARLPSPERFPLKLHFRAPCAGPQNVHSQNEKNEKSDKNDKNSVDPAFLFEHSMTLHLKGLLADIVDSKLEEIGVCMGEDKRHLVLLTDCLGVVIKPDDGVPDRHRFPIKVHIERSILSWIEPPEDTQRRWMPFSEVLKNSRRNRSSDSFRGGGNSSDSLTSRWAKCELVFRSLRKGSKEKHVAFAQ